MASNKQKQSDIRDFISKPKSTNEPSSKDTKNNSNKPSNTKQNKQISLELSSELLSKICIHRGSITDLSVDCIVNAANGGLWAGAGVCGAIYRAAGHTSLTKECDNITDKYGNIPTGQSVITNGYRLHAKYIIHSVGPISQNNKALQSCYKTALDLCILKNIKSIAFPCISTGIFGFSKDIAAPLAMKMVKAWLIMAKGIKYKDYIKLLKEKEKEKLKENSKKKKKQKKWKWLESDDSDDTNDKNNKNNENNKNNKNNKNDENDGKEKEKEKEKDIDNNITDEIKTNDNDNDNDNDVDIIDNENDETVFDRIDNIVFCCFDIGNWRLYENIIPKVFPSQDKNYSYLWNDKLKEIKKNNNKNKNKNKNGDKNDKNNNKNNDKNDDENQMDLVDSQGSDNDD